MFNDQPIPIPFKGADAGSFVLFEGLPHQKWESDAFARERARSDVVLLAGWPFYRDPLMVEPAVATELARLVRTPGMFLEFGGEKRCGGYHPDFALAWVTESSAALVLPCFGCSEAILVDGRAPLRVDVWGMGEIQRALAGYRVNRPVSPEPT